MYTGVRRAAHPPAISQPLEEERRRGMYCFLLSFDEGIEVVCVLGETVPYGLGDLQYK